MATENKIEIIEELDGDEKTGVEMERQSAEDDVFRPWDPTKIRVDPKTYSLRNIIDMIRGDDLELAPDFQRKKVWGPIQKSRLIESILLRIPLPAFYFSSDDLGRLQVVDGLQRLSTVNDFVNGGFPLNGLEYLQKEVGGIRFKDLPPLWSRRIFSTQITANVIDPQTPDQVKFDIFKRINTGGTPLNSQEIRHCMSKSRSRDFIKKLASLKVFQQATNGKLKEHPRMVDREVVLRFVAFRLYRKKYSEFETLDSFLTHATKKIDLGEINDKGLDLLEDDFERSMTNAKNLFGKHAFQKWDMDSDSLKPFNRALFESLSIVLADYEWAQLKDCKPKIINDFRHIMTADMAFLNAITTSTSMRTRIETRFSAVEKILKESATQ
jgi:hypothetical protein